MKKKQIAIWLLILIMISSCTREEKKNKLVFGNDLEDSYWSSPSNILKFAQARSGNHVCKIDKLSAFSQTFNIKAKEVSNKLLRRVKISAWFMLTGHNSEQNLVLDVRDSTMKESFEWININAADYVPEMNKWGKVELIVDLAKKNRNNPTHVFRIYACNGKEEPVYVDDFEIQFEE